MTSEQATEEVRDLKKELLSLNLLPSVAQFVSLYRFAFKLPEIEIEELEDGLLEKNEVGGKVLQDLLVALVKGIQPSRGVSASNLEENLNKLLRKFWRLEKAGETFSEDTTFSKLDIALKVEFLHFLCCMRVDKPDAQDAMKTMDADALRVQPLGNDDQGNEYWYFFGTRLYKQEPAKTKTKDWEDEWNLQKDQSFNKRGRGRPRKAKLRKSDGESDDFEDVSKNGRYMNIDEKSRWSVVCNTIEDWVDFAEKLKVSKSKNEKALFHTVTDNFLPVLNEIYQEKERRLQQKLRELVPRRIVTRRETRKQRVKSVQEHNGYDAETAHREHLARDRAQRLEERNRRLSQSAERSKSRSRRQKYIEEEEEDDYEDEDDFQEVDVESTPQSDESNDYRKEYMPVITGETTDLKSQVLKVLSEVKLQKDAWPFLYPVDESYAPGYYEIITDPMDLSTMSSKLLDNGYKTIGHIDEDFKKMVDNCKLYNGENSGMSNMVMNLWRVFRRGMSKIGSPANQAANTYSNAEPTISRMTEFPKEVEGNSNDYQMKRSSQSQDGRKKKKKKIKNMEVLEMLSNEAKIAVEKSTSNDMDGPQPRQISLYSDLKIVPIHSHPQSLIEKFSDSSNQEVDDLDSSNASASSYMEQGSNSPPPMDQPDDSEKDSPVKTNMSYFPQNEDSTDLSEFIAKNNEKGFNILSDGEGNNPILSDNETDLQQSAPRNAPYNIPQNNGRNPKASSSNVEGGAQNEVIVVEDCNNDNMSSLMSGLPRETMYSMDGQRVSPSGTSLNPHTSVSPNSTNYPRKSPPSTFTVGRNPEGQQMQRPNLCNNMTTVDATALGISHISQFTSANAPSVSGMGQVPQSINQTIENFPSTNPFARLLQSSPKNKPRYSPTFPAQLQVQNQQTSQDFQGLHQYQIQKPNNGHHPVTNAPASNNIATFTTHMATQPGTSQATNQLSKIFQNPGQMMLQPNSDSGKFPTMKVTLPPSTGELLVVPGDSANSGMTFHLFAQPHSNPSQPIQSRMQVFADGSVQQQNNHGSLQQQSNHGSVQQQSNHGSLPQQRNHGVQHQSNQAAANSVENQITTIPKVPGRENNKSREERSPKRKSPVQDPLSLPPPTTDSTTTMPYQLPSTKSIPNIPGLPRYSEAYTSASMMPTFSNHTSFPVRPNALRHHNPSTAFTTASELPSTTSNPFLQSSAPYQTMCSTTIPSAFPSYSYRQASVNGVNAAAATMTTNSSAAKPQRINLQKVYLPNQQQLNQNAIMQNGNGQFILWPPAKDAAKRSPNGEPSQKGQEGDRNVVRTMAEAVTSANFYPGANNMFTFQTASGNPSQVYAQVLPSQLPQYVNQGTPYYIVTDPNSLQNPQRYPLMNMQPIPFPNR